MTDRYREGVLTTAVRNGDWLVLDELNLAPSDVLEVCVLDFGLFFNKRTSLRDPCIILFQSDQALNRLLDDNRELFLPETQERIKVRRRRSTSFWSVFFLVWITTSIGQTAASRVCVVCDAESARRLRRSQGTNDRHHYQKFNDVPRDTKRYSHAGAVARLAQSISRTAHRRHSRRRTAGTPSSSSSFVGVVFSLGVPVRLFVCLC
jgi:hypothetical protein